MEPHRTATLQSLFAVYYAATLAFVFFDFFFGLNVRLTFLEQWPAGRALYYVFCALCFLLIWRYPAWSGVVAAVESLVNLSALIISMALKVMVVTDEMIDSGRGAITGAELLNFLLSGSMAYLALSVRSAALHRRLSGGDGPG